MAGYICFGKTYSDFFFFLNKAKQRQESQGWGTTLTQVTEKLSQAWLVQGLQLCYFHSQAPGYIPPAWQSN